MEIKGTLDYQIKANEKEYSYTFSRSQNNDLGALVNVLDLISTNKKNFEQNKTKFRGTDKIEFQNRLSELRTTEKILRTIVEHRIGLLIQEEKMKVLAPELMTSVEAAVESEVKE